MNQIVNTLAAASVCFTTATDAKSSFWIPSELMKIKLISDVQISPDNRYVLFVATEAVLGEEKNAYISKIYRGDLKGTHSPSLFSSSESSSVQPRWSPDGQWIAFLSNRTGKKNLYLIPAGGGEAIAMTHAKEDVQTFRWSPNSRHIVFVMADEAESEKNQNPKRDSILYKLDIATGAITPWENKTSYEANPRFSPDGQWVAYVSCDDKAKYTYDRSVAIRSSNGQNEQPLAATFNGGPFLFGPNLLGWTPDGCHVLFFEPKGTKYHLELLPIDGSSARELPTGDYFFKLPALSHDRTMLGFVAETPSTPPEAYVAEWDHFIPSQVSHLNQRFLSFPMPKTEIVRWQSVDGLTIEGLLTYPLDYRAGEKYPLALVIHGGPMGFFSESFIGNPYPYPYGAFSEAGFFILRPNPRGSCGYGKAFRSGNLNDWGGKDFADIMTGVDFLIAQGKVDADRMGVMGWSYGGYLYSNRAETWNLDRAKAPGLSDRKSIHISNIDRLAIVQPRELSHGPKSTFQPDWSITAWAITQTQRFKAASVGAGVTNLTSLIGTTDIHRLLPDYLGDLCENLALYQTRSPINHVQNVTTPCLIQHGLGDLRVPVSQAYEFYHALDRQGKQPTLLLYPDCSHYFEKPRVELEAIEANLDWFTKHL